jgi:hypothetical protein
MITETERIKWVLDQLRRIQGGEKVDFGDLVVRGAEDKIRELRASPEVARRVRDEIAEWIRSGNGPKVDLKAAEEVKYLGLEANYDDE